MLLLLLLFWCCCYHHCYHHCPTTTVIAVSFYITFSQFILTTYLSSRKVSFVRSILNTLFHYSDDVDRNSKIVWTQTGK
jgi:hypothetical protein